MGWNSWNPFGENVSEKVIKETADAMVSSGLKDAGFTYIVIDDILAGRKRLCNRSADILIPTDFLPELKPWLIMFTAKD